MNALKIILIGTLMSILISCSVSPTKKNDAETQNLILRSQLYQQGLIAFNKNQFLEAEKIFILIIEDHRINDVYARDSKWNLVKIYEAQKFFDKAILFLLELEKNQRNQVELLKIQQHLIFNYVYMSDINRAMQIEASLNKYFYKVDNKELVLYDVLSELLRIESESLTSDNQRLDQLRYLGIINKYVLYTMETCTEKQSAQLVDQLKNKYLRFINLLNQDQLNLNFKKNIAVEMLQQLRLIENYVIDYDLDEMQKKNKENINNIQDFLNFSKQKQKYLTEWLHQ